jgi:uncharacterized protein (DUF2384 family)
MAKERALETKKAILEKVPQHLGDAEVLLFMDQHTIDSSYVEAIRQLTRYKDDDISTWLNISPRTMRSYRSLPRLKIKKSTAEQLLLLLGLFKHGNQVFGSADAFDEWINTENFFLDNKKPAALLDTSSGIRYINDRLTAMEFGDNV